MRAYTLSASNRTALSSSVMAKLHSPLILTIRARTMPNGPMLRPDFMKFQLPYVVSDPDRHGNPRLYVRRHGRKVRIRQEPRRASYRPTTRRCVHSNPRALHPLTKSSERARVRSGGWLRVTSLRPSLAGSIRRRDGAAAPLSRNVCVNRCAQARKRSCATARSRH